MALARQEEEEGLWNQKSCRDRGRRKETSCTRTEENLETVCVRSHEKDKTNIREEREYTIAKSAKDS